VTIEREAHLAFIARFASGGLDPEVT